MVTIRALTPDDFAEFAAAVAETPYAREAVGDKPLDAVFATALTGDTACVFVESTLVAFCGALHGEASVWVRAGHEGHNYGRMAMAEVRKFGPLWAMIAVDNTPMVRRAVANGDTLVGVVGRYSYWRFGAKEGA